MGIRIDNDPPRNQYGMVNPVTKVRIDSLFVSGTSSHGVETYGVDGITIGSLTTRKTGECGILLNATFNANIGTVDAEDAGTGTGYAAFRLANRAGRLNNAWPTNIRVGMVKARGGGRGIFCVSESGGATIDRGKVVHSEVVPDAGILERRIDLEPGTLYVVSLADGREKASRLVAAR